MMDQKQIDPGETWRTYHGTSKLIQKTRVVRMFGLKRRRCPKPEFNVTYSLSLKHHSALGDSPVLLQWLNTVELVFDLIVSNVCFLKSEFIDLAAFFIYPMLHSWTFNARQISIWLRLASHLPNNLVFLFPNFRLLYLLFFHLLF